MAQTSDSAITVHSYNLIGRTFAFGRIDGTTIGTVCLGPDGSLLGYQNPNERYWGVQDGKLVFRGASGQITTSFGRASREGQRFNFRGEFCLRGPGEWHTLTEIVQPAKPGILAELRSALYGGDEPVAHAEARYIDHGYPHTNLLPDLVGSVLDTIRPRFWLELGSMVGGSALRVADAVKAARANTEIVCVDPFTGDVNMWAWEQATKQQNEWQFLRLERGRPTIYDRFLANVAAAGHADIILPIQATSIVGLKLLRRLAQEQRISSLPEVIYLDSAHEPGETFLELHQCWDLLQPGGALMGDDWSWEGVRNDVLRFARTIQTNPATRQLLAQRHRTFTEHAGILLDRGQWVLVK